MKKWRKHINIVDARKLSHLFCNYFDLTPCNVYYVDALHESKDYGLYFFNPPTILILEKTPNQIGILIHELTHHLENEKYPLRDFKGAHGYNYQLAKERVIKWCNKFISPKPDWRKPLSALQYDEDMKKFRL